MEPTQDWQSPQFVEQLNRLDRGGFSFEFLRRNPKYREDYKNAMKSIASDQARKEEAITRLSRRWGVVFPGRPERFRPFGATIVATGLVPRNRHHRRRARRFCRHC